jgi:hypothetical protein
MVRNGRIAWGNGTVLGLAFAGLFVFSSTPSSAQADPDVQAVLNVRDTAEALLGQGDQIGAGGLLAQSLRDLPASRPELVDVAFGNLQLAVFAMQHLMNEATLAEFRTNQLQPDAHDVDRLLDELYTVWIGSPTAEKTAASRELTMLTVSDSPFVRITCLYILSDPYYYSDPAFTKQYQMILADQYPDLEITEWSLRFPLYSVRSKDLESLADSVRRTREIELRDVVAEVEAKGEPEASKSEPAPVRRPGETDRMLTRIDAILSDLQAPEREADGVAALRDTASNDTDWRLRYGAMLLAEPYRKHGYAADVEATAKDVLARRSPGTPDVLWANVAVAKVNRAALDAGGAKSVQDARAQELVAKATTLLNADWEINPFDRVIYEDVMKNIRNSAQKLGEHGYYTEGISLYQALANKYPSSVVSAHCDRAIAALQTERSSP